MELIREIITPTSNTYTLNLPDEMIGKKVEVIAFELDEVEPESITTEEKISRIKAVFKDSLLDLSGFKFNRNEANNYDE